MTTRNWLDEEKTERSYILKNRKHGDEWIVIHEYRKHKCPHCGQYIYNRLTHIRVFYNDELKAIYPHLNHEKSLDRVKELAVQLSDEENIILFEKCVDGIWYLMNGDQIFAESKDK